MAVNTELFLKRFCRNNENAVVYAHIGHTAKLPFFNMIEDRLPLGKLLSDKYGNEYYSVGLWGMEGRHSYIMNDSVMYREMNISYYPHECIEYQMRDVNDIFSIPSKNFYDGLILSGTSGNIPTTYNFSFFNFKRNANSVVFIPKVEAQDFNSDLSVKANERNDFIINLGVKKLKEKVDAKKINESVYEKN